MSETARSLVVMCRANIQPLTEGLRGAATTLSNFKGQAAKLSADFRTQIANATAISDSERDRLRINQQYAADLEKIGRIRRLDVETAKQLVAEADRLRQIQLAAADNRASEQRRAEAFALAESAGKLSAELLEQRRMLEAANEFERQRLAIARQYEGTLERINAIKGIDEQTSERLVNQANALRIARLQDVNRHERGSAAAEEAKRVADEQRREKETIDALNAAFDKQNKDAAARAAALVQEQATAAKTAKDIKDRLAVESALTPLAKAKVQIEQQYAAMLERINELKNIDRATTQAMITDARRLRAAQLESAKVQDAASSPLGGLGSIFGNSAGAKAGLRVIGAGMAIGIAAEMAARIGDAFGTIARGALEGQKPWQEFTQEGINALPIIGSVNKAMSSIGATTMDVAAATAKWMGFSKETQRALMSGASLQADIAKQAEETAKRMAASEAARATIKNIRDQVAAMREITPIERERKRILDDYAARVKQINDDKAKLGTSDSDYRAELEAAEAAKNVSLRYAAAAPQRQATAQAKERIQALQAERAEIGKTAGEIAYMRAIRDKLNVTHATAIRLQTENAERERATQDAKELVKAYQQQAATLGMTSEQLEIYKLKLAGASEESLRAAESARQLADAARLQKDIDDANKSLKGRLATMHMTSEQAEIYRLRVRGATSEQLKQTEALAAQIALGQKRKEEWEKMKGDAKSLVDSTRTPMEEYRKKAEETRKLYAAGLIDRETYGRVWRESKERLREAAGRERRETTDRGPGLVLKDSVEAYRLQYGGKSEELKTWKDQLLTQKRIEANTRDAAKANTRKINRVSMN